MAKRVLTCLFVQVSKEFLAAQTYAWLLPETPVRRVVCAFQDHCDGWKDEVQTSDLQQVPLSVLKCHQHHLSPARMASSPARRCYCWRTVLIRGNNNSLSVLKIFVSLAKGQVYLLLMTKPNRYFWKNRYLFAFFITCHLLML